MTEIHELTLPGCSPDPLASYLKALGTWRLIAEQCDAGARGRWQNDMFILRSTLDEESITQFLMDEYCPSPILSPWNRGSGFYPRDNSTAMDAILATDFPRTQLWREVIAEGHRIVARGGAGPSGLNKDWILAQCRARFHDDALDWLDASYVLTTDRARFPPLLGTGGNDGRLEFSNNFMQHVVLALNLSDRRNGENRSRQQLHAALFGVGTPQLERKRSTGFFNPGGVGGANATSGFNDDALTNPWDYVLMFEGALLFAGAAARRLSTHGRVNAVFPFTVSNSAGGYGTAADSEYGGSARAEFWAPLWERPTSLRELRHFVAEGRASLGRRQAATGTEFARAVTGLGTDRGISQFQRFGFLVRNGLAYLAAPLGRFHVHHDGGAVERADLLFDLDTWLDRLRTELSGRSAPSGLGPMLRRLDDRIIEFCRRGRAQDLQEVLIAVGHLERWLGRSGLRREVRPFDALSREWLQHTDDGSPEFRLARALGAILEHGHQGDSGARTVGPIRHNFEPVKGRGRMEWQDGSPTAVWKHGDPLLNLLAVLERRILESQMKGFDLPALESRFSARLSDLVVFINGAVDVDRVMDLAFPISFMRFRTATSRRARSEPAAALGVTSSQSQDPLSNWPAPRDLPVAYATMKLTLLPFDFECRQFGAGTRIRTEPAMLAMLRAGRIGEAYQLAVRRLWASGLRPLTSHSGVRDGSELGRRIAAALVVPLNRDETCRLAQRALRPSSDR